MWLPASADEVVQALKTASLEETHTFDGKRALSVKNLDTAIDVCAMTVDGGSLLYGAGEDQNKRLTVDAPFVLAGVPERIDQIVQTSIAEPPTIQIRALPLDYDPSRGYVLVAVPPSPRAPHMVIAGGAMLYYGRGATGNRVLTEAEIAGLYARREQWGIDRDSHLARVVADAPNIPSAPSPIGFMHAFVRPIGFDSTFLRREWKSNQTGFLAAMRTTALTRALPNQHYTPDLTNFQSWGIDGGAGVSVGSVSDATVALRMTIGHDGEARLFSTCARKIDQPDGAGTYAILEHAIAGNLARFLAAIGAVYEKAGFIGSVDVGVALTGILGGVSMTNINSAWLDRRYPHESFENTTRVLANELVSGPDEVARQLLRTFNDGVVGMHFEPLIKR
jgi:hypothetical protein